MKRLLRVGIAVSIAVCPAAFGQLPDAHAPQSLTPSEVSTRESMVFKALDLNRPELAAIGRAWSSHDVTAAVHDFATYLRRRDTVHWISPTKGNGALSEQDRELANKAVEGELQGGQTPDFYTFPGGKIDWHYNASRYLPNVAPDNEWQWQLNRMNIWLVLARAYTVTHDECYAATFRREMISWIAQSPAIDRIDNTPGSTWRTIEAGIRMGDSWPTAFFAFRGSRSLRDEDLVVFASSFLDHARFLRRNNTHLNFLTMEMSGLFAAGAVFPEFRQANEWRSYAVSRLAVETRTQFLPDGAQDELSTEYQNVALKNILKIVDIARVTGRLSEIPKDFTSPLEKAFTYELNIMAPDRTLPRYNNGLEQYLPDIFHLAVENFPNREDFIWVASKGREGHAPNYTSVYMDRAGEAAMRSGWGRDANYLGIRVGPMGMGHQHQDKLGTVIWAFGRQVVFNSGGGSYEVSKWRTWATTSYGANCVLIDGQGQNRPTNSPDPAHDPDLISQGAIEAHWISNPVFDFVSGIYNEGYGPERVHPATQQRDVLFLKPDLFIVADRMRPSDNRPHTYQARWQLLTTKTHVDTNSQAVDTTDPGQPNLAIVPLMTQGLQVRAVSGQQFPEILGWNVRKDMDPEYVPATTLLHTLEGKGPKTLLTLFVPLKPGNSNPVERVESGTDGRSVVVHFKDGRSLRVRVVGELGIAATEILANGKQGRRAEASFPAASR